MTDSGDCASVASSIAQETLQYIQNESERQRRRLQSLKKNSSTMGHTVVSSGEALGPRSIMLVKSLEESLSRQGSRSSNITTLKRNVRVMKRNVNLVGREGVSRRHSTMSSLDSSPHASSLRKISIDFSSITIREHPVIPGENPGVSCGVPLTLDWEHEFEDRFDLDEFESKKTHKRRQVEMKIPASKRADMLRKNGFGWVDIQKSIKQANISRHKRKKTLEQLERQEKFRNGIKNIFVGGRKKSTKKKSSQNENTSENSIDDAEEEYQDISKLKRMDSLKFIDTKKNNLYDDDDELNSSCRSESLQKHGGLDCNAKSNDVNQDDIELSTTRSPRKYNLDFDLEDNEEDENGVPVRNIEIRHCASDETTNDETNYSTRYAIAKDTISTSEISIGTPSQGDELLENQANKIVQNNGDVGEAMNIQRERTSSSTSIVSETEINCACFPYIVKLQRKQVPNN